MVFECFHNFLAFSQWGNTLFNIMARLETTKGDPAVRSWFEKTMKNDPDETDKSMFTRLDRFVMELFRTISPHAGSLIHRFLLYNNLLAPRTLALVLLLHLTLKPVETHLTGRTQMNSTLNATIKLRQVNRMMKSRPSKSGWHNLPSTRKTSKLRMAGMFL